MSSNKTIGRCIYCNRSASEAGELTKEHVLPRGLFGDERQVPGWNALTLLEASCKDCKDVTGAVEGWLTDKSLWAARRKFGRQPPLDEWQHLAGFLGGYHPPSFLRDEESLNEVFHLQVIPKESSVPQGRWRPKVSGEDGGPWLIAVRDRFHQWPDIRFEFDNMRFCRFLAKVGLGVAVDHFGIDAFVPCLQDIILGRVSDIRDVWRYVGGTGMAHPIQPGHSIYGEEVSIRGDRFACAHIKLFAADERIPSYFVVVGKIA